MHMRLFITEASRYIGVSKDTLRRWEKKGFLTSLRTPTNRRYYTKEILDNITHPGYAQVPVQRKNGPKSKVLLYIVFSIFIVIDILLLSIYFFF